MVNFSKVSLNTSTLHGVREPHREKPFGLRSELKASELRMKRTKSGHRITKASSQLNNIKQDDELENLIPEVDIPILSEEEHMKIIKEKQEHLEKTINSQIEKEGFSVNFRKKYKDLDKYLNERK